MIEAVRAVRPCVTLECGLIEDARDARIDRVLVCEKKEEPREARVSRVSERGVVGEAMGGEANGV